MVASTQPETIEQYSIRVAEAWKLGRAQPDDGVLLLVATQDRTLRIEVGYGLEGVMPDADRRRIIDETITPLFRQGDLYGGIDAGLSRIISVVDGEPLPPPDTQWRGREEGLIGLLPMLFFGVLIAGSVLRAVFGRTLGALMTGGLTGGVVWLVSKVLLVAGFAGVAALLFSLFAGVMSNVRNGRGRGGGGPWGGLGEAVSAVASGAAVLAGAAALAAVASGEGVAASAGAVPPGGGSRDAPAATSLHAVLDHCGCDSRAPCCSRSSSASARSSAATRANCASSSNMRSNWATSSTG